MSTETLPKEEIEHLRALARRQAEIAALPVMEVRKRIWTETNDAVPGARPPFAIESWTFDRDFLPADLLQCTTRLGRGLEAGFLRHIRHHEILNDDHVCPDTLDIGWHVALDEYGIEIPTQHAQDSEGKTLGYHFDCPIKDLDADGFAMVKPSTFSVDREGTLRHKAFLEEIFGDILPVVIRSGVYGRTNLTQRLMRLMSMETFFMAMYDCPEKLHGIMRLLCDNALRMCKWAEAEGLLVLNNENQCTCGTCYNWTTLLPKREVAPGAVRLSDMWAGMDSQETVGVSPELFHEFCFPYYRELAELFGLVYWGCCEPADPIWETSLRRLPNLKAVSISRWADQDFMAEALDGAGIVYSRKPDPNLLGVDPKLDEAAWANEIRTTLRALEGKTAPLQFVVRDVYSMHGDLAKPRRAVEIAREEIDRIYGPVETPA
ncbi:MAG: hypothetical protein ACOCX4_00755 [Planctomycetota bacterium]